MDFGNVVVRNVEDSWERSVPMEVLERSTLLTELLFSTEEPSDPPVLQAHVQAELVDSWLRYVSGPQSDLESWSHEDLTLCLKASDFLGDPDGVHTVSAILGKRLFSPAAAPSAENLVSCLSTLKLEPRAVQVLRSVPETLWAGLLANADASYDICINRLPQLFLTPSRMEVLQSIFSSGQASPKAPQKRSFSNSTDTDSAELSSSTISPLLFSMDMPWGKATYCVSDSTQVDQSCVRMENCTIDAPFNPDSYAPGLASEFLEALGMSGCTLEHLEIVKFLPKSEVYFRDHPAQDQSPVPKCSALQHLAPGLAALSGLKHLDLATSYQCDNCSLYSFVEAVGYMQQLTHLHLGHISVRRESMRDTFDNALGRLTDLRFLALKNCSEADAPMESLAISLAKLSQLTGLILNKRVSAQQFIGRPAHDCERKRQDASCLLMAVASLLYLEKLDLSSIPTSDKLSYDIKNPEAVLRKFVRTGYLMGDNEVNTLAGGCYPRMQVLTMMTSLNLGHSSISDQGAMDLGYCLFRLTRLQDFNFSYNDVKTYGAQCVASSLSFIKSLRRLDVSGNSVLKEGAAAYASALGTHPGLQEVKFEDMATQSRLIMQRLLWTLPQITSLVIEDPEFDDRAAQTLAKYLRSNSVLRSLTIKRVCNLSSEAALTLAPTLAALMQLTHLTIEAEALEEEGGVAFCAALAWSTNLEQLDIRLDVYLEYHCCKVLQASLQWLGRLPQSRRDEIYQACAGDD